MRHIAGKNLRCSALAGAAALLMLAATAAAAEGGEPNLYGDLGQAITAVVIFVILLLILRRWAWKPIIQQLRRREQEIEATLEQSQKQSQDAADLLKMYKAKLDGASAQADKLLDETRKAADEVRRQIVEAARSEAHQTAEKVRQDIEHARKQAMVDLRDATAQLATEIAGRVLRDGLSDEDHRRLLDLSLAELDKKAAER